MSIPRLKMKMSLLHNQKIIFRKAFRGWDEWTLRQRKYKKLYEKARLLCCSFIKTRAWNAWGHYIQLREHSKANKLIADRHYSYSIQVNTSICFPIKTSRMIRKDTFFTHFANQSHFRILCDHL